MAYTKLFNEIVTSTIWGEPDHVRIVWITMLAIKDIRHEVQASIPGLAHFARVSVEQCREALRILESPDKESRTKAFEGRRIKTIDGGWLILNGEKYREKMSIEDRRQYNAKKQRQYYWQDRERHESVQKSTELYRPNQTSATSTQAEAEAEAEEYKYTKHCDATASVAQTASTENLKHTPPAPKGELEGERKKQGYKESFLKFWEAYPKKIGKGAAAKAFDKFSPKIDDVLNALAWQLKTEQWQKDKGAFIPHPATYLNQRRWEDEPPEVVKPQVRQPEEACSVCRNNTGLVYSQKANGMVLASCKHGKAKHDAKSFTH